MFELKQLTPGGIPGALEKVERYRLLNEPWEAESICRDVLLADPENQGAVISLLLAMTDRFSQETGPSLETVRSLLPRIRGGYERAYYAGVFATDITRDHAYWTSSSSRRSSRTTSTWPSETRATACDAVRARPIAPR